MKIQPQDSMKGTVVAVSKDGKKAVVQTVHGLFSVAEVIEGSLKKGDIVTGYLESAGRETIVNETRDKDVKVVFTEAKATREQVSDLL